VIEAEPDLMDVRLGINDLQVAGGRFEEAVVRLDR
jgi:hypothetical protein